MTIKTEKPVLTDKETLKEVIDCLREHIPIKTQGAYNQEKLYQMIVGAASQTDTIENGPKKLKKSCTGRNIRYHLINKIDSFKELETQLNKRINK